MTLYLLNSAVLTGFGHWAYYQITDQEARDWIEEQYGEFVSTIGYEETAAALSELLGVPVPVNRITARLEPGDRAIVFRLVFPPGAPRIDPKDKGALGRAVLAGNYELGLLEMIRR